MNIEKLLKNLADKNIPEADKWIILSIILREFMLGEGIDLEYEIQEIEEKSKL